MLSVSKLPPSGPHVLLRHNGSDILEAPQHFRNLEISSGLDILKFDAMFCEVLNATSWCFDLLEDAECSLIKWPYTFGGRQEAIISGDPDRNNTWQWFLTESCACGRAEMLQYEQYPLFKQIKAFSYSTIWHAACGGGRMSCRPPPHHHHKHNNKKIINIYGLHMKHP